MFEPFHEVVSNVSKTILTHEKALGRPVIGVMPAYFPMELIEAAGGYPVQLWGNNLPIENSDAYLQSYCCSVERELFPAAQQAYDAMIKAYKAGETDILALLDAQSTWVETRNTRLDLLHELEISSIELKRLVGGVTASLSETSMNRR